jgi:hypothetical protein
MIAATRHLAVAALSALLTLFIHASPAKAVIIVDGKKWDFAKVQGAAESKKIWGPMQVDRALVMKFLYFASSTPTLTFTFGDEKEFINNVSAFITERNASDMGTNWSPSQQLLTTDGMARHFADPEVKKLITARISGGGGVSAPFRNFLDKGKNQAELKAIAALLSDVGTKVTRDDTLRLFRTMNVNAAGFLKSNLTALKNLALDIAEGKKAELSDTDRNLLNGQEVHTDNEDNDDKTQQKDEQNGQSKGLYGHYGDVFQASTYLHIPSDKNSRNSLVEFTLRPGAHILLFSPLVATLSGLNVDLKKDKIADVLLQAYGGYTSRNGFDGYVRGWLGIKHEARGDFSLSVGSNYSTKLLLMLLVDDVVIHSYDYTDSTPWK